MEKTRSSIARLCKSVTFHPVIRIANSPRLLPGILGAMGCVLMLLLSSCQTQPRYTLVAHRYDKPRLGEKTFTSADSQTFSYRKFISQDPNYPEPKTVVIALHGFCGASIDYENLGKWLVKEQPGVALYAYEIRGQGLDPVVERRGDIDSPENWFLDLNTFTSLVRREHPRATIVWQGESMGALILANTYRYEIEHGRRPGCDAIVITSPVVGIRGDFPVWKKESVRLIARVFPAARLSLDTLSGGQKVQMTSTSTHSEQSETNAWHIERHTLRLLLSLSDMIDQMKASASTFRVPTLIVHGGKDYFSDDSDVISFYQNLSQAPEKKRLFYPEAHHLLMYDAQKDVVIQDIGSWLGDLPPLRKTAKVQR